MRYVFSDAEREAEADKRKKSLKAAAARRKQSEKKLLDELAKLRAEHGKMQKQVAGMHRFSGGIVPVVISPLVACVVVRAGSQVGLGRAEAVLVRVFSCGGAGGGYREAAD